MNFLRSRISILLIISILLCVLPLSASAEEEKPLSDMESLLAGITTVEDVYGTLDPATVPDAVGYETAVSKTHAQRMQKEEANSSCGELIQDELYSSRLIICFDESSKYEINMKMLLETAQVVFPDECVEKLQERITAVFPTIFIFDAGWDNLLALYQTFLQMPDVISVEYDEIIGWEDDGQDDYETVDSYDPGTSAGTQWHLDTIGVMDSWNMSFCGSTNTIVAVLDSGCESHADLQGVVDYSLAYNVVEDNTDVTDTSGHGTHIAGIIGALLNESGTNGICQNITIVPIKITHINSSGSSVCSRADLVNGIEKAEEIGATVINISYSLGGSETSVCSAITSFGGLVVFSAGNNSSLLENDSGNSAKANDEPLWVVVGASNESNTISSMSNYSANYVDIFAPGSSILSLGTSDDYVVKSGTSMAAPMVTAAIAIIASHATHLSADEIKNYLIDGAYVPSSDNPFAGKCVSNGLLSISSAIELIYSECRGAYSRGDADGNGYVDSTDYLMTRRAVLGTYTPTTLQEGAMDVNGNGILDAADYLMVRRYVLRTFYFIP